MPNEGLARFSGEFIQDGNEDDAAFSWKTRTEIQRMLSRMREGDALVVNHSGYAEPGVNYPSELVGSRSP